MKKQRSTFGKIISFFTLILTTYVFLQVYSVYKTRNLNDFIRAEENMYTSTFSRDFATTLGKEGSYKIESETFNDAIICREMEVKPHTAYKVSCMVKTEDVITRNKNRGGGAHISINGTVEKSCAITGTQDWTELVLYFNSGNRTNVNIGFRLGGYDDECIGTAWFDDIKFEVGSLDTSNEWDFVCFIFKNLNVQLDGKTYEFTMKNDEINQIKNSMARFKDSFEEFSNGKLKVNYEIIEIDSPITSLSYDEENAYYVGPENISNVLDAYLNAKEYDHIFTAIKLDHITKKKEKSETDWIGLGGMVYHNIGFSNIRLPNSDGSYMYKYIAGVNEFPEEVFVHEFLHTLERNAKEFGYERPELHSYKEYGYKNEIVTGLKKWYIDYMNHNIKDSSGQTYGLDEAVYTIKPVHESNFEYSMEIDIENEPENLIEEIRALFEHLFKVLQHITQKL